MYSNIVKYTININIQNIVLMDNILVIVKSFFNENKCKKGLNIT